MQAVGVQQRAGHQAFSPGQSNVAQSGLRGSSVDAAGGERHARGERVGDAVEAQHREAALPAAEPVVPTCLSPAITGDAGVGREAVGRDRHDAGARGAAMLHARHHLLADVAALVEIDAGELVHVGLVREGVAVDEVEPAARHAERDAMRLVGVRLDELGAEIGGGLLGEMRRQHDALAERGQPRVGIDQAVFGRRPLPSQTASTPSTSDRSSQITLARSL